MWRVLLSPESSFVKTNNKNSRRNNNGKSIPVLKQTSTTSNYDVLVVKHRNYTFKSTPFQAAFSEKALRARDIKKMKSKELTLFINDEVIDLPMRIDPQSGRVQFQKKYIRRTTNVSDSSDISDDERMSNRSSSKQRGYSKQRKLSNSNIQGESIDELKNEQAPKNFWQFAWLFSSKNGAKKEPVVPLRVQEPDTPEEHKLARIKQQPYEGEESQKQPLFQLSLCGHLISKLRKDAGKEQLQKMFYANKIEYKEFIKDPFGILNDANLVVRIDNSLYTWQLGAAILACKFAFGKEPDEEYINDLIKAKSKKSWLTIFGRENVTKLDIQEKTPPNLAPMLRPEETQIIRYRKAPDSEMLTKMNLKMGQNKARFVLQIAPGLAEETEFKIFLWDQNEKVVISDIDGTITRSDVMGQLKTNYIHKGVCLLFNELYKRNYKMLYMTARAIGQYGQTRRFLEKEVVENDMRLPPGPLLMSPDGYLKSFSRQVIDRTPDQLKIKLLASVNQIFPNTKKPLIAGFGNRQTDSIAYLRIKIAPEKIFCINQKSIITTEHDRDIMTNYTEILEKIDDHFPVYNKPDESQTSNVDPNSSKEKGTIDETEEEKFTAHRKLSHSEFYERSPSKSFKEDQEQSNQWLKKSSRPKSAQGEPTIENLEDLQSLMQQFKNKAPQNKKQE